MYRSYPILQTEIENILFEKCDQNLAQIYSLVNGVLQFPLKFIYFQ